MMIGQLQIDLFAEGFHSLKEKRRLLSSLKERLHNQFNVAVAESDHQEQWQRAQLTVVGLGATRAILDSAFSEIEEFIDRNYSVEISRMQVRYY